MLKSSEKRLANKIICLGCGARMSKDCIEIAGVELEVCRSWVRSGVAANHLTKVCRACYNRVKIFCTKTETEFVGVQDHNDPDDEYDKVEIKSEPDYEESNNENSMPDENDSNSEEIEDTSNQDCLPEDKSKQSYSEEECESVTNTENQNDCIEYKTKKSPLDSDTEIKSKPNVKRKWNFSLRNDEVDEDYVPSKNYIMKNRRSVKECKLVESSTVEDELVEETLQLERYSRTFRIGCCIFNGCKQDCVSLIPRTVRRRMIIEFNVYVPPKSRVCEEHLLDQNWEQLSANTTKRFRANHCQDMKNIIREACLTNFDFENIEMVEARLVRYWFDVNKSEFNRIFDYFPKLKRLKEAKTTFALYLMHLQKTSSKRIALLLKIDEKLVKRAIRIVGDITRCDSYEELKNRFLDDD